MNETKQKAIEFVDKFKAKQCAIIAVDEIIESHTNFHKLSYWNKVKSEIEKL